MKETSMVSGLGCDMVCLERMAFPRSRALNPETKKVLGKPEHVGHPSSQILVSKVSKYWPQTPIGPSKPNTKASLPL